MSGDANSHSLHQPDSRCFRPGAPRFSADHQRRVERGLELDDFFQAGGLHPARTSPAVNVSPWAVATSMFRAKIAPAAGRVRSGVHDEILDDQLARPGSRTSAALAIRRRFSCGLFMCTMAESRIRSYPFPQSSRWKSPAINSIRRKQPGPAHVIPGQRQHLGQVEGHDADFFVGPRQGHGIGSRPGADIQAAADKRTDRDSSTMAGAWGMARSCMAAMKPRQTLRRAGPGLSLPYRRAAAHRVAQRVPALPLAGTVGQPGQVMRASGHQPVDGRASYWRTGPGFFLPDPVRIRR